MLLFKLYHQEVLKLKNKPSVFLQIGKNGLNSNFIQGVKNAFNNRKNIKIRILKSGGREKEKIRKIADEIISELGANYTAKIIGFTIAIKKWRKPRQ